MTVLAAYRFGLLCSTALEVVPPEVIQAIVVLRYAPERDPDLDPFAMGRRAVTNPQILHPHAKTPTVARIPSHCSLGQWMAVRPAMERAGFHTAHNPVDAERLAEFDPEDEAVQHALEHPEMYPRPYVRMLQNLVDQKAAQAA